MSTFPPCIIFLLFSQERKSSRVASTEHEIYYQTRHGVWLLDKDAMRDSMEDWAILHNMKEELDKIDMERVPWIEFIHRIDLAISVEILLNGNPSMRVVSLRSLPARNKPP